MTPLFSLSLLLLLEVCALLCCTRPASAVPTQSPTALIKPPANCTDFGLPTDLYYSTPGVRFGFDTAISNDGSILIVSAPDVVLPGSAKGEVLVYTRPNPTFPYSYLTNLTSPNTTYSLTFGYSVAVDTAGDVIVVGAPNAPSGGFAYIYVRAGTKFILNTVVNLLSTADLPGSSVAVSPSGKIVAIGNQVTYAATSNAGQVVVVERVGSHGYYQLAPVVTTTSTGTWFGASVAVTEQTLVIGEPGASPPSHSPSTSTGQALIFMRTNNGTLWGVFGTFLDPNGNSNANVGSKVAISNDGRFIFMGTATPPSASPSIPAKVYICARASETRLCPNPSPTPNPNQQVGASGLVYNGVNAPSNPANLFHWFGYSFATSANGSVLAIGSPLDNSGVGAVSQYAGLGYNMATPYYALEDTPYSHCLNADPITANQIDLQPMFGFSVSVSGDGHTLVASAPYASGASVKSWVSIFGCVRN